MYFDENGIVAGGICTCAVGRSGLCAHVICILYQLILYTKTGNLKLEIACTTQPQQWHKKGKGNVRHYKPVNQVQVKSAKASKEPTGNKTPPPPPVKRNIKEKVEEMATQLSQVEVEKHFLLTLGQNKTTREKGGLYPSLAYRYITHAAEGDHDYCRPSSTKNDDMGTTRTMNLPEPFVIQPSESSTSKILYYPVQQRSLEWFHIRKNRITASVVADLLGIGGSSKVEEAWAVVLGKQQEKKKNFMNFQRGIEYEGKARKLFVEESGESLNQHANRKGY